ncbi:MAG: hypothetical protein H0X12_15175 [Nocardioides sp.]|nr:hypothetical protein [Nocardioides sp.]
MSNSQMTQRGQAAGLHMQWVEVRDEKGRVRMEAHWVSDAPVPGLHQAHAA